MSMGNSKGQAGKIFSFTFWITASNQPCQIWVGPFFRTTDASNVCCLSQKQHYCILFTSNKKYGAYRPFHLTDKGANGCKMLVCHCFYCKHYKYNHNQWRALNHIDTRSKDGVKIGRSYHHMLKTVNLLTNAGFVFPLLRDFIHIANYILLGQVIMTQRKKNISTSLLRV